MLLSLQLFLSQRKRGIVGPWDYEHYIWMKSNEIGFNVENFVLNSANKENVQ